MDREEAVRLAGGVHVVAAHCHVRRTSVYRWISGVRRPALEQITRLAQLARLGAEQTVELVIAFGQAPPPDATTPDPVADVPPAAPGGSLPPCVALHRPSRRSQSVLRMARGASTST